MLEGEFSGLAALVSGAKAGDCPRLEQAFADLVQHMEATVELDLYTEGARDGVRAALEAFVAALQHADAVPRFTVARRRYNAHEAVWALHDELHRQCTVDVGRVD